MGMPSLAETYDVALVDLDGVVYMGTEPVDHAAPALARARAAGMRLAFVTNNAARRPEAVAEQLTHLGVTASTGEVVTSAQAAARLLTDRLPAGARVLVVGGEGLTAALTERGLTPVATADDDPAAVVSGFHPDVGWRLLAEGAYAVAAGLPWVASNVDPTIPMPRGKAPGNGALVETIRMATGRYPMVAGKPEPPIHREAILRTGARHPLVIGDRLDTDIEGAVRAGADSLLVLTGVTGAVELVTAPPERRPSYVAMDLRALFADLARLAITAGSARRGRFVATVERGKLTVQPAGVRPVSDDAADLLRAVCGAVWAAVDRGEHVEDVGAALAAAGWPVPVFADPTY
jgi:HAD superfamily hydrolase (TIGR01450 family)